MWILGVMAVCGAICSLIVTAKGHEWWIGLLLGVFGPLGIVVAAVMKSGDRLGAAIPPPPAGARWAPDPTRRHELRLWDGTDWTAHVSDQGRAGHDPLAG